MVENIRSGSCGSNVLVPTRRKLLYIIHQPSIPFHISSFPLDEQIQAGESPTPSCRRLVPQKGLHEAESRQRDSLTKVLSLLYRLIILLVFPHTFLFFLFPISPRILTRYLHCPYSQLLLALCIAYSVPRLTGCLGQPRVIVIISYLSLHVQKNARRVQDWIAFSSPR